MVMEVETAKDGEPQAVEIVYEKAYEKIEGQSHEKLRIRLQGVRERDQFSRAVPQVLPPGCVLKLRWINDMAVELFVDVFDADAAKASTTTEGTDGLPLPPGHADARRRQLEGWSMEQLKTTAAELSVKIPDKASKSMIAGLILDAELTQRKKQHPVK